MRHLWKTRPWKERGPATDILAELARDPLFVAEERERDARLAAAEAALARQEQPILRELAQVGVNAETVWNIQPDDAARPAVAEVVFRHLELTEYEDPIRDALARSMGTRRAAWAWNRLLVLYRAEQREMVKDGLAAALGQSAPKDCLDALDAEVKDPTHGESRLLLLDGYRVIGTEESRSRLELLADDPFFEVSARALLRRKWPRKRTAPR